MGGTYLPKIYLSTPGGMRPQGTLPETKSTKLKQTSKQTTTTKKKKKKKRGCWSRGSVYLVLGRVYKYLGDGTGKFGWVKESVEAPKREQNVKNPK